MFSNMIAMTQLAESVMNYVLRPGAILFIISDIFIVPSSNSLKTIVSVTVISHQSLSTIATIEKKLWTLHIVLFLGNPPQKLKILYTSNILYPAKTRTYTIQHTGKNMKIILLLKFRPNSSHFSYFLP